MPNIGEHLENSIHIPDRRTHPRQQARSLAYIDLGEDNGGIVLNISEGGMAVQAVVVMEDQPIPRMRLLLPQSQRRLETAGQIAWLSESRKEAGVRFVDLPADALSQIREWISCEATGKEFHPLELASPNEEIPVAVTPVDHESRNASVSPVVTAVAPAPVMPSASVAPAAPSVAVVEHVPDPIPAVPTTAAAPRVVPAQPVVTAAAKPDLRIPRLMGDSEFKLLEKAAERRVRAFAPRPRKWLVATILGVLAVLSFYVGLATGRGNLNELLASMGWKTSGNNPPSNSAATADLGEATAPANTPADQAEHSQSPAITPAQAANVNANPAPASLTLHRQKVSSANDSSTVMLNLPETPVSASASVAISTRRSIPVPPDSGAQSTSQGESLHVGEIVSRAAPVYPPEAQRQNVEGIVLLHATIKADGTVESVEMRSGPELLGTAAMSAVREWRYKPTLFNGQPIGTEEDIKIVFRLPH